MVCNRCKMVVKNEFENLGLYPISIEMGEVELQETELTDSQAEQLNAALNRVGFELIDDRKGRIIEQIKKAIINIVHYADEAPRLKHSEYISGLLHYDYSHLSKLFSEVEGLTIEQYIILQKIEKVKELLVYDEFSLTDIAYKLGYSSVAHLSSQFKKVTGLTPGFYKNKSLRQRTSIDHVGKAK